MTMMTANGTAPAIEVTHDPGGGRALNVFASFDAFQSAWRMAGALSSSTLVPKQYQGEDGRANCLIAIELASRVGASVFMVMQSLDVIQGRPSWSAKFLIGTVNAGKRFTPLRFRWTGTPGNGEWGCRAYATDLASGEELVGTEITLAIAKLEGWYDRSGSKWKTIPEQMLQYRAAAFWTRVYCPEIGLGLLTTEEAADLPPELPSVTTSTPAALEQTLLATPPAPPTPMPVAAPTPPVKPAEAKSAPAAAAPAPTKPRAATSKPEPPFGKQEQAKPRPSALMCAVCGNAAGANVIPTQLPDGTRGVRHPGCNPLTGEVEATPTDGEPPSDYQSDADDGSR